MSDLFANPLEEMIEFQDLKTDRDRFLSRDAWIRRRCICCPSFRI